jgi:hypothetical protein
MITGMCRIVGSCCIRVMTGGRAEANGPGGRPHLLFEHEGPFRAAEAEWSSED